MEYVCLTNAVMTWNSWTKNGEENTIVEREEEMTKPPKLVMAEVEFAKTDISFK